MRNRLAGWIEFLKSNEAILLVLILALGAQLPHTAVVFQRVSTTVLDYVVYGFNAGTVIDLAHAMMAAIAVEVAVLVFVVRGQSLLSWAFAVASATMNMIYYWRPGWRISEPTVLMIGAILWAVLLPAAIAFYSHEIGDGKQHVSLSQRLDRFAKWLTASRSGTTQPAAVTGKRAPKPEQPVAQVTTNGNGYSSNGFDAFADAFAHSTNGALGSKPNDDEVPVTITQVEKVGQMKAEGFTTKDIAQELGVSESTVRVYHKQYRDKQQSS